MSKLQELINKLCPNGVEFKPLREIGDFFGGLTGKSKEDFIDGNARFISYMNVYSNPALKLDLPDFVKINDGEKQNVVQYGDILFTGSSETPNECGMSSVVTTKPSEPLYLNSFCFGFRLIDINTFNLVFLKHLLRSYEVRSQIAKTANGVTTWGGHNYKIEWKKMGEIGTFIRGNGLQKKDFTESGVGCIHYGQIYTHYGTFATKTKSFVSESFAQKLRKAKTGDIVIATTSENVEDVGKAVAWLGNEDIAISGDAYIYTHEQNPKFIAYLFQTERFLAFKKMNVSGTKVTRISGDSLAKYPIPIPPLELQEKIVAILDRFETLVNDLTNGLPAEIAAVKDQYEYYRNKLLTFKKLSA